MKIGKIIGWSLLGAFLGAFLYMLYTGFAHPDTTDDEITQVVVTGALVGAVLLGGRSIWKQSRDLARERAAQHKREREQVDRDARATQERREALHRAVVTAREGAERHFLSLPGLLTDAADGVTEAHRHKTAGAYSPFWAAIERASVSLGQYNATIHTITNAAASYPALVREYEAATAQDAPPFPVTLDAAEAVGAGEAIAAALRDLAYDAQRDPVYAQIWEQRRTTAAVVAGFASLEMAIDRMAHAVQSSSLSLAGQVPALTAGVHSNSRTVAGAVRDASTAQDANSRALQAEMNHAVWLLNDQRERALGWRL